jgi:N-acetyl-alpha-D-muramate 1-phosphate uridylyltransferase
VKAMILAAGRGERMRPLTDDRPKPLLQVGGRRLIEWHLAALARAGIEDIVVNLAWRGAQIREALGDGARYGVHIRYSEEPEGALETGGGIFQALPWLGPEPFWVVNGDVWTDFDFARTPQLDAAALAVLVLVPNPPQHPAGDFALRANAHEPAAPGDVDAQPASGARLTFSGLGVYRPQFFDGCAPGRFPLLPLLRAASAAGRLRGQRYDGLWFDIGTPQRLSELDQRLAAGAVG